MANTNVNKTVANREKGDG